MTRMLHVAVGDKPTREHARIFEAYCRERPPESANDRVRTAANMNRAIGWLNQPLPHIVVGGELPTERHILVFEAWNREHEQPTVWSVANINLAVDWWNALPGNASDAEAEEAAEAVAQAWHYPDTGE